MRYYSDYPTKPIGGGNPYSCCAHCEVPTPEINGSLERHQEWCEYRKLKQLKEELELARLEVECLKLDRQKPVYCVALGWCSEQGQGEDLSSVKVFFEREEALAYQAQLEADESFCSGYHYVDIVTRFIH